MQNKVKYRDIGVDFTPEDEKLILQIHLEMPKMSPEEEAEYDKELKQDIEAAKHPIKLL
jgi:hypothetical protein